MKATVLDAYKYSNALGKISKESLDPIIAYKFFKFGKATDKEVEECEDFLKGFRYDPNGLSEKEIQEKEEAFKRAWEEATSKEIELPELEFKISDLTGTKVSLGFIAAFENFIKE